jgi:poly-gamma-glutamate synthesis protein (capsule biosynthesis protein)
MSRGGKYLNKKQRKTDRGGILIFLLAALLLTGGYMITHGAFSRNMPPDESTLPPVIAQTPDPVPDVPVEATPEIPAISVSLIALGDNLMHNTVMWSGQKENGNYDFSALYEDIRPVVEAADIACINQETIYISDPNQFTNYPSFGGPVQIGEALAAAGFDVVEHATNHCYDKGMLGINDTIDFWRQHPEVQWLGIHDSQEDAERIRVIERSGIRIAMLNYTYGTNAGQPRQTYTVDYLWDRDKIAGEIASAKALADFVLVFPHWGTEGTFSPDQQQRDWGQFFADQGVGAVIGGHPHTLQPVEVLKGKNGNEMPCFWSLGNFISHMAKPENMLGGLARLTITKDSSGTYVSDFSLEPTMTWVFHGEGRDYRFRGMRLIDYTEELAESHLIPGTAPQTMWDLYHKIVP